jgi:hypothetical protein
MRLRRSSLLPCPVELLVGELVRPALFHCLASPMLVFDPAQTEGVGKTNPVVWHDAGYGDLIKVWDHKILLEDFLGMTRYADEVEIDAGPLTVPAWLFAQAFYLNRQRRLSTLVSAGFSY